jgi:hypothetical protein
MHLYFFNIVFFIPAEALYLIAFLLIIFVLVVIKEFLITELRKIKEDEE